MMIQNGNLKAEVLKTGILKCIMKNDIQYNLFQSNVLDNSLTNVYIKLDGKYVGLLDNDKIVKYSIFDNGIKYISKIKGNTYEIDVIFSADDVVKYSVKSEIDESLIFIFDVGMGDVGFLNDKQSYSSQYIDNKVFENENGYSIAMRRTLRQSTGFPQLEVKCDKKTVGYFTEGYDFFDLTYKFNQELDLKEQLKSRSKTYEMAYFGLETEKIKAGEVVNFYLVSNLNNEDKITDSIIDFERKVIEFGKLVDETDVNNKIISSINGEKITKEDLEEMYSDLKMVEYDNDGEILGFFTTDNSHVVLSKKEELVQRSHGHIITTGDNVRINNKTLVATNYMNGVFSAQVAIGNVGEHFLNTNTSSNLDLQKIYGQRILVKINGEYRRLNVPSLYEMGFNYAKWIYKFEDIKIEVVSFTDDYAPVLNLQIKTSEKLDIIVTDNITEKFSINIIGDIVNYKIENDFQKSVTPKLEYKVVANGAIIDTHNIESNTIEYRYENIQNIDIELVATQDGNFIHGEKDFAISKSNYLKYYERINGNFKIDAKGNEDIEMYNTLIKWYTHNALIHFSTPHGLEQHSGSAWGLRDVCQGPLEFFFTFKLFDEAREVLLTIFKNQNLHDGSWPQWFMFDNYEMIRADDAHGDVIVWPIKALADYLMQTKDYSILEEEVPYFSWDTHTFTEEKYSIKDHVAKEIEYIRNNYLEGTHISSYGHGDWDDTLRPANSQLRKFMSSGWTVPLTYQAFNTYAKAMYEYDENISKEMEQEAELIAKDYRKYMIKDDVVAGFIYKEEDKAIKYMLHPLDNETGIKYRLLPINRSIISGLFTNEEITSHLKIVDDKLKCPDGVRLMDKPGPYDGGTMKYFQRAESASTVGREISLQYVHAHIRYIEALAKINNGEEIDNALRIVTPFMIRKYVPNADFRQSNAYFSSSEGDFDNRYEYAKHFDLLKTGDIKVKGGWRIYSSGPGIYLNQLVSNYLGIKIVNGDLVISPSIASTWKGTKVSFVINNCNIELEYKLEDDKLTLNGENVSNRYEELYKDAGYTIRMDELKEKNNIIIG